MEVLIVIGLVAVLSAIGTMSLARSREHAQRNGAAATVVSIVKDAQSRAVTAVDGKAWGVRCQGNAVVVFAYTSTQPEVTPEQHALPAGISCTVGSGDVRFEKLTGTPDGADMITLHAGTEAVSRIDVTTSGSVTESTL